MDPFAPVKAFDRLQRRHWPLAIVIAVLRNFSDHGAGNASVLIAYWAFFSIFPLLLLFTTALGFVLQGDPGLQHSLVSSATAQVPIVGGELHSLHGSGIALAISIVITLWSALGVTVAAQNAFNRVYAVPTTVSQTSSCPACAACGSCWWRACCRCSRRSSRDWSAAGSSAAG